MKKTRFPLSKEERAGWLIFIATFIVYAVISMTKSAYAASMAAIIGEGIFTKSEAGIVNAAFYLFYGGAQLLGIKIVDKVSPVKFVYITLIGTLISTTGMSVSDNFYTMLFFWSFCGLIQFAMWPAVLRIISEYILPKNQRKAMTYISFCYCVGMLLNYLVASVVLEVSRWPVLFVVLSVVLVICIVLWACVIMLTKEEIKVTAEINRQQSASRLTEEASQKTTGTVRLLLGSGVFFLLITALIRTELDAGIKSWIPTMIVESYPVSASFASLLTTILVFINLSGIFIANFLHPRYVKNAVWGYGICYLAALPFTAMLLLVGKIHVAIVVIMLIAVTTMMYAAHQFINVIIPSHFSRYNKTGAVAAMLNAVASFGAVIANVSFGYLAQNYGWNVTTASWIILTAVAFVFCSMAAPLWHRFTGKESRQ